MKALVEVCASVVTAQVQRRRMTSEEISDSIRSFYKTLESLNRTDVQATDVMRPSAEEDDKLNALRRQPLRTIQQNSVVCLECGRQFRLLSNRHLSLHGLTPREYKVKWGISLTTALSARSLTSRRRKTAKAMGMGKELAAWRDARKELVGSAAD